MVPVSLLEVRESVREKLQIRIADTGAATSKTYVDKLINRKLRDYHGKLCEAYGDDYETVVETIAALANTSATDLPERCHKIKHIFWIKGVNDIVEVLKGSTDASVLQFRAPETWTLPRYRTRRNQLIWLPTPNADADLRIEFSQLPADLVEDGDTFDGGANWDEWVVLQVCLQLAERSKREGDITTWTMRIQQIDDQMKSQVLGRAETDAPQIRDERGGAYAQLGNHGVRDLITVNPFWNYR